MRDPLARESNALCHTNFGSVLVYLEEHPGLRSGDRLHRWLCSLPRTAPEPWYLHSVVVCEIGALPELLSQATALINLIRDEYSDIGLTFKLISFLGYSTIAD
ncbi:hypothetical protein PN466_11430 [Roseofilum reptotaenium CS-1145]|uniref:Uncharacterized protein n=1 Tax=Roseofilum reptotaenium AO1-A TaxID=1925591 RepID=A0A1L9QNL7_9CYAN|nr:hypothetical protein [Roseofilum reptotaenium]MDB9517559.1 hypothetical protein [Roseofilum reptotaenium CS-1145]OJJ24249.1 hypothetical protein BI308_17380 [Roseofilum reptotaenium AO1-A]